MLKLYYANIAQLDTAQKFHALFEKVNIQRREKILRCKNEKDKFRSLLAGYLLRTAVEREGLHYEELCFLEESNGKPVIQNRPYVHFSLSHAGNYAVCLISDQCCGVDVETQSKKVFQQEEQLEKIAKRILSKREYQSFVYCSMEEKIPMFLQFWTRKESYSKADGRGVGIGLDQVETGSNDFFSSWLDEDTYLSIYVEDENYADLQIEEVPIS